MKKTLLLIAFIFLFLTSCKKSSSVGPVNTFSATINGTDESFNTNIAASNNTIISLNSALSVFGTNGSANNADVLSITLNTNNTIATGTYSNAPGLNEGFISILYSQGPNSFPNSNIYSSDVDGKYVTTVKITSISSTNVQGTFTAQLVYTDGKTIKSITNGKFNVNLK